MAVAFYDREHHHYAVDSGYQSPAAAGWDKIATRVRDYETLVCLHNEVYPLHLKPLAEYPADLRPRMLAGFRHKDHYYLLLEMGYFFTWGDDFGALNTYQLVLKLDKKGHLVRTKEFDTKWGLPLEEIKKKLDL